MNHQDTKTPREIDLTPRRKDAKKSGSTPLSKVNRLFRMLPCHSMAKWLFCFSPCSLCSPWLAIFGVLVSWWFLPVCAGGQGKPLGMEESVAIALRQSPQARAAQYERDAAQVTADREKPVARPTLNATAAGTLQSPRVTFPRPDGTNALVVPGQAGRLDLVVEQTLYRAGQGAARQRYAAQSSVVDLDYRRSLSEVALSVRKAYLDVLRAESGLRIAQDGLTAAQRYGELVRKQIEAGQAKPVDAKTAEAQATEAQDGVFRAEGGLALARQNFNRLLGRSLDTTVALEPLPAPPVVPQSPEAAVTVAQQRRPELITLEQNLRSAKAGVTLARRQGDPSFSLRGQVTQQTPTAFVPGSYVAATLEMRWPILDGGKKRLDTKEAQAQAQRLEFLLEDARQGIAVEVRQAWQKMREANSRIGVMQSQVENTQALATVAEKAYEIGRGTAIEVQGAQRELRAARERQLQAVFDLYTASAEFIHAQGADLPESALPLPVNKDKGNGEADSSLSQKPRTPDKKG